MALNVPLQLIRSDKDTAFTGGLAQNAGENANLVGLQNNQGTIESVIFLADQRLAWEIQFYSRDTFDNADLDLDTYLGSIRFAEGDGLQVAGAGSFKYDVHGLAIPYMDLDSSTELHVKLVNRSATAKNAGATGEVVLITGFRPGTWV